MPLTQLAPLLAALPQNPFYAPKLAAAGPLHSRADFTARFPFTTKQELIADQLAHPPYGTNLTFPLHHYTRFCQTSGTTGAPLRWLDTPASWQWLLDNWTTVFQQAGVTPGMRIFFAFSFGPFLGFWTAFEAATRMGCLAIPGGGMRSASRLRLILDNHADVLCCTPTYAIHLAEVAAEESIDLSQSPIRRILVAGEPGGSVPSVRRHIESLWPGARVFDHHGMTEVGPVSYGCPVHPTTLHIIESAFLAEIIHPATTLPVPPGAHGELVLTNYGRTGSPLLRYRTGDLVQAAPPGPCACGSTDLALTGGIIGRTDDMVVVRGVNVYPSAIDEIVRATGGVAEYRVHVSTLRGLSELSLTIEPAPSARPTLAHDLAHALQDALSLRIPIDLASPGSLPRFEMKARRWIVNP